MRKKGRGQRVKGVTGSQSLKEFSEPREASAFASQNAPTDLGWEKELQRLPG